MWCLIGEFARNEPSSAVLFALVSGTVERLAGPQTADRVIEIVELIMMRAPVVSRAIDHDPRNRRLAVISLLYLYLDHPRCREVLFEILRDPGAHTAELVYLCGHLRGVLDERSYPDTNSGAVSAADRAWAWIRELCLQATRALQRRRDELPARATGKMF